MKVSYTGRTMIDGVWHGVHYQRSFSAIAPSTVAPHEEFILTFQSAPILPVITFNRWISGLKIAYRVSGPATVVSYETRGGQDGFTVTEKGPDLVLSSEETFEGGIRIAVPNVVVTVRAGESGTITTSPGGSDFADPSFYWDREHTDNGQWDPFECYVPADQPVVFTVTEIASSTRN